MDHSKKILYKILSRERKGFNEARFYHLVFCENSDPFLKTLRDFLPAYRGLFHRPTTGRELFLILHIYMKLVNSVKVSLSHNTFKSVYVMDS